VIPPHVKTTDDVIHWGLDAIAKECHRRVERYGDVIDERLLDLLPLFRMTHTRRARKCFECGARIESYEIHFVKDGSYLCQRDCMRKPEPPRFRLIRGGLDRVQ
jgi:hypothetical protein